MSHFATFAKQASGSSDLEVGYSYDYADRRIRRSVDVDGKAGPLAEDVSYAVYAGVVRSLEIHRDATLSNGFG